MYYCVTKLQQMDILLFYASDRESGLTNSRLPVPRSSRVSLWPFDLSPSIITPNDIDTSTVPFVRSLTSFQITVDTTKYSSNKCNQWQDGWASSQPRYCHIWIMWQTKVSNNSSHSEIDGEGGVKMNQIWTLTTLKRHYGNSYSWVTLPSHWGSCKWLALIHTFFF